jgi:basic membrane lipoprotein Med (substrate-binding protein (PBP1-ABC) superfamily)
MRRVASRGWLLVIAAALISGAKANAAGGHTDKQLRVGYVTSAGATHDQSVGQASYEGFRRAVLRLGLQGRVVEVGAARDPNQAVASLARQRYDLIIIAIGDPFAVERAARTFPKVRFLLSDIPITALGGHLKNVQTFVLRVQKAGFLAGYLAGLIEKRRAGRARLEPEPVPRRLGDQPSVAECLAQPGHGVLQDFRSGRRRLFAPQLVDEAVDRKQFVGVKQRVGE